LKLAERKLRKNYAMLNSKMKKLHYQFDKFGFLCILFFALFLLFFEGCSTEYDGNFTIKGRTPAGSPSPDPDEKLVAPEPLKIKLELGGSFDGHPGSASSATFQMSKIAVGGNYRHTKGVSSGFTLKAGLADE
jgi:hypothetical protein